MTARVVHGDCIEVMQGMADNSVDAVVTDPPYNLSDSGKRDSDCLRRIISEVLLPENNQRHIEGGEGGDLAIPTLSRSQLRGTDRTFRVLTGIGMPVSSVHLNDPAVSKHEINASDEPSAGTADGDLPGVLNTQGGESGGDFVLQLADGVDVPFCNATCSCFTEQGEGRIAVRVTLPRAAGSDGAGVDLGAGNGGNPDVGNVDNPQSRPVGAADVMAGAGAVMSAVLSLDLRRGTGQLLPAGGAFQGNLPLLKLSPKRIRAGSGAGGFAAPAEPGCVSQIDRSAHRAFTLNLPAHGFDSTVTAKGFMGKTWDGWDSPASFQRWCAAWATEAFRVLKPGGYALVFGGTRTSHRLAVGVEDAGFEIRDSIAWLHTTGGQRTDLLTEWEKWTESAKHAGVRFKVAGGDSAPAPVLLSTSLANSPADALIAELSSSEAPHMTAGSWRSVLAPAAATTTGLNALVTIAGSPPGNHAATRASAGSTVPEGAPHWLSESIVGRLRAGTALRIWLGSSTSTRPAATAALCAALTDDLKFITCAQSRTFRNYDTTWQMVCVSATTVTTTAYTAASLISFTADMLGHPSTAGGDATEAASGPLAWVYGSGFP